MATIKSHTDLEQSKKLAEILPLESADMWLREVSYGFYKLETEIPRGWYDVPPKGMPCWSLAALLAIYPMALVMDFSGKYAASCISSPMSFAGNPIDAVYEIIIWLNENKHLKNNKP